MMLTERAYCANSQKNPKNANNAFHVEHLVRRVWSGKLQDAAPAKNPKKNLQEIFILDKEHEVYKTVQNLLATHSSNIFKRRWVYNFLVFCFLPTVNVHAYRLPEPFSHNLPEGEENIDHFDNFFNMFLSGTSESLTWRHHGDDLLPF